MKQARLLLTMACGLLTTLSGTAKIIEQSDFGGYDYNHTANLWKAAEDAESITHEYYYAPGWAQIADPEMTFEDGTYTYLLPSATYQQWQAQCKQLPQDLTLDEGTRYDFSCIIQSNTDGKATLKMQSADNDQVAVFAETVTLKAGKTYTFYVTDCPGFTNKPVLVLDFGGNASNTVVSVGQITLKDSSVDDGTVLPTVSGTPVSGYAYDSEGNI